MLSTADADRVAEVFTKHQAFVEAVARQYAPRPVAIHVPDIVQAVAVQVCRGLNGFREEADIKTWLYRITVNTAHDYYRGQVRQQWRVEAILRETPLPDQIIDPDEEVRLGERSQALYDAVQQMKPKVRRQIVHDLSKDSVLSDRTTRRGIRTKLRLILTGDPRIDEQ